MGSIPTFPAGQIAKSLKGANSMNRAQRIANQLGMSQGAANNKLRKQVLYRYVRLANHHFCYKCGAEIETVDEFSIEHILPWEGRDSELFWDLENISFSHSQCNRPHIRTGPIKHFPEGQYECPCCKELKNFGEFYKNSSSRLGISHQCKQCHNDERDRRLGRK